MEIIGIQGNTMSKAKELCKRNGISYACSNFEELYETGIDTVYIAVPNYLHYNYCKMALEKGIHVIVEKPITSNLQEALSLKSLAARKECFLFEAVTTLYLENYKKIKEWLPRIEKIKIVQSQYSQYSRRYDAFCDGVIRRTSFNKILCKYRTENRYQWNINYAVSRVSSILFSSERL